MTMKSLFSRLKRTTWLQDVLGKQRVEARRSRGLQLEMLEHRLAPATMFGGGGAGVVFIDLDQPGEALTIQSNGAGTYAISSTAGINSAGLLFPTTFSGGVLQMNSANAIQFTDSANGTSITFNDSGSNHYTEPMVAVLDNFGAITFNGTSTFDEDFSASASGDITSSAGSTVVATVGDLTLNAGGNVLLDGTVTGGNGVFSLFSFTSGAGGSVRAVNAGNDFQATVQFNAGAGGASLHDSNSILFDNSTSSGAVTVTAGSNITQLPGTGITTVGNSASFTTTSGLIDLTGSANAFFGPVLLRNDGVAAANSVAIFNAGPLVLGGVLIGNGAGVGPLAVTAQGNITQTGRIFTAGNATFTIDGVAGDVFLASVDNHVAGSVTVGEVNAGDLVNLAWRNINPAAAFPLGTPLTTPGDVNDLILIFDNNSLALPTLDIAGNLSVSVGGALTQAGALLANGSGLNTFTVLGNFSIDLSNTGNDFVGSVALDAPNSDFTQTVAFTENGDVLHNNSQLGLGTLSVTSVTGNILQQVGTTIAQPAGAGAVTFTTMAGAQVHLDGSINNEFTGPVQFSNATDISLQNGSPLAAFPTLPAGVTDLDLFFLNAPVLLPSLNLSNLSVVAASVYQAVGSSLTVTDAHVESLQGPIALTSALNDFDTLALNTLGPNAVSVIDVDDIDLAESHIGNGSFTLTTAGDITQSGPFTQTPNAGWTTFSAGAGNIALIEFGNDWTGPLFLTGTHVTLFDSTSIILGTTLVTGDLDLWAQGGSLVQAPGTTLNVTGDAMIEASGGDLVLDNFGNFIGGPVCLCASQDSTFRSTGPVQLTDTSVGGTLTVRSNGPITEADIVFATKAIFDAGTAGVLLDSGVNDFDEVWVISTGSAAVKIGDIDDISLGRLQLGSGALTITAAGDITDAGTGITQTGPGAVTFETTGNVTLDAAVHTILGTITVNGVADFALDNSAGIAFSGTSSFSAGSDIDLTSGALVTLPTGPLAVGGFHSSAVQTNVADGITADSIGFEGAVNFIGAITLQSLGAGEDIDFDGNVLTSGTLTLILNGAVNLESGVWNQAANNLVITGASAFQIGDGSSRAVFAMSGGVITAAGIDVLVASNATFQVGSSAAAETVQLNNAGADLVFDFGSFFAVGLGATNDKLIKQSNAGDLISIESTARLRSYSGLADAAATTVLDAGAGQIAGRFALTVDNGSNAHDFLAGTDIVTPTYTTSQLALARGGVVSTTGSVTGFEPDGDKYTITASTGGAAQLVVITNTDNQVDIVIRNAAAATTLTVTTTKLSGDGFTEIGGIGVNGPAGVTISAPAANLHAELLAQGRLIALTAHDFTGASTIRAGGGAGQTTTIKGHYFSGVAIELNTVLTALTLAQFDDFAENTTITAERFGNVTITGDAANNLPGDFRAARVVNRHTAGLALPAVGTVKVARELSGAWDIAGRVTSVTAKSTSNWNLGLHGAANVTNADLLTNVGTLSLGAAANVEVHSFGRITTVTAFSWAGGDLHADSFGAISITGNAATGIVGNLDGLDLLASGNAGGSAFMALTSLTVAGSMEFCTVRILDGNVGSIKVAKVLNGGSLFVASVPNGGKINLLQSGAINDYDLEARALGALKALGKLSLNTPGDLTNSHFLLHGKPGTADVALGSVTVTRNLGDTSFHLEDGSLPSFRVARTASNLDLYLGGAADGKITALSVGAWQGGTLTALSIGALSVTGAAAVSPDLLALPGNLQDVNINAFRRSGTAFSIGALKVAGDLLFQTDGFLLAPNGIGSFTVGHNVQGDGESLISVSRASATADSAGRIGALTVGAWSDQDLIANSLGTVKVTGFTDVTTNVKVNGDVSFSDWSINGRPGVLTPKAGIGSLVLQHDWHSSRLAVPFGINTFRAGGGVRLSRIVVENPLNASAARIGAFQAGTLFQAAVRASSIGTFKTVANSALNVDGLVGLSTVVATRLTAPISIGTVSVAGGLSVAEFLAPGGVTTFSVAGAVSNNSQIALGFMPGGRIGTATVASFSNSRFITRSIGTLKVQGNAAAGIGPSVTNSLFMIRGNGSGAALGSFLTTGTVSGTTFNVNAGGVSSFVVGRFLSSDLLIGFHLAKAVQLDAPPAPWLGSFAIAVFKTTQPFSSSDVVNTAAFRDSNVVAARLGAITITGLDSIAPTEVTSTFGVAFRDATGGHGTLTINGVLQSVNTTIDDFIYLGLPG